MKVKFLPSGEEHDIEFNETILHLAQRCNLHIQSVCKGIPSCAECRIQIKEGEHHVLPPSKKEVDLIGTAHYVDMSRLSCQLRCFGDVTVDLSEQIEKAKRVLEKPRDRMARRDGQTSRAVLGGILDNVVSDDVEVPEVVEGTVQKERIAVEKVSGDPNLDKRDVFYGDFYKGDKKKNQQRHGRHQQGGNKKPGGNGGGQQPQAQGQKAAGGNGAAPADGSGKKRKRRNRNRNRNRTGGNPGQQGPSSES